MNVTQRMASLLKPNDVVIRNGVRYRLRYVQRSATGDLSLAFQPGDEPLSHLHENDVLTLVTTGLAMFEIEGGTL